MRSQARLWTGENAPTNGLCELLLLDLGGCARGRACGAVVGGSVDLAAVGRLVERRGKGDQEVCMAACWSGVDSQGAGRSGGWLGGEDKRGTWRRSAGSWPGARRQALAASNEVAWSGSTGTRTKDGGGQATCRARCRATCYCLHDVEKKQGVEEKIGLNKGTRRSGTSR
jgi:hypothetical protein